jgi:hypothetical protein
MIAEFRREQKTAPEEMKNPTPKNCIIISILVTTQIRRGRSS